MQPSYPTYRDDTASRASVPLDDASRIFNLNEDYDAFINRLEEDLYMDVDLGSNPTAAAAIEQQCSDPQIRGDIISLPCRLVDSLLTYIQGRPCGSLDRPERDVNTLHPPLASASLHNHLSGPSALRHCTTTHRSTGSSPYCSSDPLYATPRRSPLIDPDSTPTVTNFSCPQFPVQALCATARSQYFRFFLVLLQRLGETIIGQTTRLPAETTADVPRADQDVCFYGVHRSTRAGGPGGGDESTLRRSGAKLVRGSPADSIMPDPADCRTHMLVPAMARHATVKRRPTFDAAVVAMGADVSSLPRLHHPSGNAGGQAWGRLIASTASPSTGAMARFWASDIGPIHTTSTLGLTPSPQRLGELTATGTTRVDTTWDTLARHLGYRSTLYLGLTPVHPDSHLFTHRSLCNGVRHIDINWTTCSVSKSDRNNVAASTPFSGRTRLKQVKQPPPLDLSFVPFWTPSDEFDASPWLAGWSSALIGALKLPSRWNSGRRRRSSSLSDYRGRSCKACEGGSARSPARRGYCEDSRWIGRRTSFQLIEIVKILRFGTVLINPACAVYRSCNDGCMAGNPGQVDIFKFDTRSDVGQCAICEEGKSYPCGYKGKRFGDIRELHWTSDKAESEYGTRGGPRSSTIPGESTRSHLDLDQIDVPSQVSTATASPQPSRSYFQWADASLLAQETIGTRVKAHVDHLGRHPVAWLCLFYRALVKAHPYTTWSQYIRIFSDSNIDEWILLNEKWLHESGPRDWQVGMVTLDNAFEVFPNSHLNRDHSARLIHRFETLPGYQIMCHEREDHVCIQPSTDAFQRSFELISAGLLNTLDWNNVIVAGGIVLGALVNTDCNDESHLHPSSGWEMSDVDVYIHGLSPSEANRKVQHIFDTFRGNLPPHMRTLAIRNAKTITLYADYPLRRIQIVLKLAKNPRDILLNFDLDICAMGWDGSNVWMLPRAARALEIHGHYLSDRRASQLHRVFKYAEKGYGLRILPSYMRSLTQRSPRMDNDAVPLNLSVLEEDARIWVEDTFGQDGFHVPRLPAPRTSLSLRSGFTWLMRRVLSHQRMSPPIEGAFPEQNAFESTSYEDACEYAPRLQYQWNEAFNHARFRTHLMRSNIDDVDEWIRKESPSQLHRLGIKCSDDLSRAQRMTFASTAKDLLADKNDIRLLVLLPVDFAIYANELVAECMVGAGLDEAYVLEPFSSGNSTELDGLFWWTIGGHLMWQQFDRRIDELFEVLYAFRRATYPLHGGFQYERFCAELSRRNVGPSETEFGMFRKWISGQEH
ncbi:hypothetical protein C8R46DRAFT_1044821 [Mycena filopes]|nr:hypothetical protein C8R46DRAFT_1044821 [Mycena filopes]